MNQIHYPGNTAMFLLITNNVDKHAARAFPRPLNSRVNNLLRHLGDLCRQATSQLLPVL